jgi:hypothetical protein
MGALGVGIALVAILLLAYAVGRALGARVPVAAARVPVAAALGAVAAVGVAATIKALANSDEHASSDELVYFAGGETESEKIMKDTLKELYDSEFFVGSAGGPMWAGSMEIDAYSRDLGLAAEFNGPLHYKSFSDESQYVNQYSKTRYRDKLRVHRAMKYKSVFIVVPHVVQDMVTKSTIVHDPCTKGGWASKGRKKDFCRDMMAIINGLSPHPLLEVIKNYMDHMSTDAKTKDKECDYIARIKEASKLFYQLYILSRVEDSIARTTSKYSSKLIGTTSYVQEFMPTDSQEPTPKYLDRPLGDELEIEKNQPAIQREASLTRPALEAVQAAKIAIARSQFDSVILRAKEQESGGYAISASTTASSASTTASSASTTASSASTTVSSASIAPEASTTASSASIAPEVRKRPTFSYAAMVANKTPSSTSTAASSAASTAASSASDRSLAEMGKIQKDTQEPVKIKYFHPNENIESK